jgi:hypothetical protein
LGRAPRHGARRAITADFPWLQIGFVFKVVGPANFSLALAFFIPRLIVASNPRPISFQIVRHSLRIAASVMVAGYRSQACPATYPQIKPIGFSRRNAPTVAELNFADGSRS